MTKPDPIKINVDPTNPGQFFVWIAQYGYLAIFCLLMFGIVGLPVPDETLLTFTGYLVYKGTLSAPAGVRHRAGGQRLRHQPELLAGADVRAGADSSLRPLRAHHRSRTSTRLTTGSGAGATGA